MQKPLYNSPQDLKAPEKPVIAPPPEGDQIIVNPGGVVGTWVNANPHTSSIVKIVIGWVGGHLTVHAFGACSPNPCDWGQVNALAYGDTVSSTTADAFSAVYAFAFKSTILTGEIVRTFLQVDDYNHFTDASGRSDYHTRETFRRA